MTGNRYRENYDAHHLDPSLPLAVLADGMGDGPGSAFAGRTAVDASSRAIREAATPCAPAALRAAVAAIHAERTGFRPRPPRLTGCTLTAFVGRTPTAERGSCRSATAGPTGSGTASWNC